MRPTTRCRRGCTHDPPEVCRDPPPRRAGAAQPPSPPAQRASPQDPCQAAARSPLRAQVPTGAGAPRRSNPNPEPEPDPKPKPKPKPKPEPEPEPEPEPDPNPNPHLRGQARRAAAPLLFFRLEPPLPGRCIHTHMYAYRGPCLIYAYAYAYACMCVCACACRLSCRFPSCHMPHA